MMWPTVTKCTQCNGDVEQKTGAGYTHEATVWDGSQWSSVRHGTKRCVDCGARHKLNYVATPGMKKNTVKKPDDGSVILLHGEFGFAFRYLRQLFHRVYRLGSSWMGEAATIILTYPNKAVGHSESMTENHLGRLIQQGFFIYLRRREEHFDFDVDDPVPDDDPEYGVINRGLHMIFNASRDDPSFKTKGEVHDVVTDGNWQCSRRLVADEKQYADRRLPGRPKAKAAPKTKAAAKAAPKVEAKPQPKAKSRCRAVTQVEDIKVARTQTGGLFATINMKNVKGRQNQILHLAEMMNGECTAYKKKCAEDMKESGIRIGKYAHDCACVVGDEFVRLCLCAKAYLDGMHSKNHKCGMPAIKYKKKPNSQACEQFWSRLDKIVGLQTMSRAHYRCFLAHYCTPRNKFVLDTRLRSDATPLLSFRKQKKRRRGTRAMKRITRISRHVIQGAMKRAARTTAHVMKKSPK